MPRSRARAAPLKAITEDVEVEVAPAGLPAEVLRLIENLETQVEEKVASIMSAAEDAIADLKIQCQKQLVLLPKKYRDMPLDEFQQKFPEGFESGALKEIRERYAAMSQEAAKVVPATTARGGRTAAKRRPEPETVLRTVRARRGGTAAAPPTWGEEQQNAPVAPAVGGRRAARSKPTTQLANIAENEAMEDEEVEDILPKENDSSAANAGNVFNGMPLQTPLPFTGAAMPMPVTMLTQKRGGRTKAVGAPDAAVVTTADGKQWALGKNGAADIPESHRAEVQELLSAQFEFLAAALGKTVFQRPSGRGGRKK